MKAGELPTPGAGPPQTKGELRARCQHVREELGSVYQAQASGLICRQIEDWPTFQRAKVVLTYLPMRGEVDVRSLLARQSAIQWGIPRIAPSPGRHLTFHAYQPARLVRHRFGMFEPEPTLPEIPPDQADLIIVPGLAYTRLGYRLGYGGGFYDRLLTRSGRAHTLGVCYQALLLDDLPLGPQDVPVESLATEVLGVIDCLSAR